MRRRSPLAAIAVAGLAVATMAGLLVGGLGGTAAAAEAKAPAATAGTAGCGKAPALASGTHTIQSSGQARSYILELPGNYTSSHPYRLIFAFHWLNGTAARRRLRWQLRGRLVLLRAAGAGGSNTTIFVAPQGINNGWANSGGADVTFVDDMLSLFESGLCIDTSEIFAMGFSYGGAMTYAVACAWPTVFRAVAVYSGRTSAGAAPAPSPSPTSGSTASATTSCPSPTGGRCATRSSGTTAAPRRTRPSRLRQPDAHRHHLLRVPHRVPGRVGRVRRRPHPRSSGRVPQLRTAARPGPRAWRGISSRSSRAPSPALGTR